MSDNTFMTLFRSLNEFSDKWIKDENRIFNLNSYIFDFYKKVAYRIPKDQIIGFVLNVFSNDLKWLYPDCFRILQNLDFAEASDVEQKNVLKLLCDIVDGNVELSEFGHAEPAIIRFGKSAKIDIEELNISLKAKRPDFYETTYSLEVSSRGQGYVQHIQRYLADADRRNKTQGLNGCYSGYSDEPYDVIYNILSFDSTTIDCVDVEILKKSALETLSSERQTVTAKISAIQLLIYLCTHYTDKKFWVNIVTELETNADVFSTAVELGFFDKTARASLQLSFSMLLSCFCDSYDTEIIENIFSINQEDAYWLVRTKDCIILSNMS